MLVFSNKEIFKEKENVILQENLFWDIIKQIALLQYNRAMALVPRFVQSSPLYLSPTFICHLKPSFLLRENPEKVPKSNFTRRIGAIATMAKVLLAREAIFNVKIANGFDFKMVAPGQTLEEAESGIRGHALALLQVKALIESEAWKDMQKALRKSSSLLKQDIYTIIQSKPGSMRPQLRKLYSNLFNNVTRVSSAYYIFFILQGESLNLHEGSSSPSELVFPRIKWFIEPCSLVTLHSKFSV